jgi:hypothetical protein
MLVMCTVFSSAVHDYIALLMNRSWFMRKECWVWLKWSKILYFQGENVPAPFMSFEAAGFPPDLLKEVMPTYILRRCFFFL